LHAPRAVNHRFGGVRSLSDRTRTSDASDTCQLARQVRPWGNFTTAADAITEPVVVDTLAMGVLFAAAEGANGTARVPPDRVISNVADRRRDLHGEVTLVRVTRQFSWSANR
jgi:hypothetical protein